MKEDKENEDIKYLEDLIPFAKMLLTTSQRATIQEKEIEVLENLIARNKELEEQNKVHENSVMELINDLNKLEKELENTTTELNEKDIAYRTVLIELDRLDERNKELEEEDTKIRAKFILQLDDYIPKSKIKEKIEEQIEEADDVLEKRNYIGNFNGTKKEQKYYFDGYKDATLFMQELLD